MLVRIAQSGANQVRCSGQRLAIGVQEPEDGVAGLLGTRVHLRRPAFGAEDAPICQRFGQRDGPIPAAAVDDDQLAMLTPQRLQGFQTGDNVRCFVQDG